jgi:NhaP-type Na+/H+ or K+/H+ antiporter
MTEFIFNNQIAFYYSLIGLAFLGLTFEPALRQKLYYNIPVLYILVGVAAASLGLPVIDPLNSDLELKIVEHISELIVIVSLTGAGLAIDLKAGWKSWQPTWRLLMFAMPMTMISIALWGVHFAGLSLGASILLGAAIAPTDPVLARSVSVGSPNSDQDGAETTLTSEAGLNDGLAFPFVWLAIGLVAWGADFSLADWALWELGYKVLAGIVMGYGVGWVIAKILFSDVGDAKNGRANVAVFVLAATFIAYGLAEFVQGYGFLSVFIAARAGRKMTKNTKAEPYENAAHESADQLESILLAVILLWFGSFIGGTLWRFWTWEDFLLAALIVLLIRPVFGWLSLIGHKLNTIDKFKISFFGIRGMGTIFYIAYALSHAQFDQPERIWSIASLTIILSAVLHGSFARQWMVDEN